MTGKYDDIIGLSRPESGRPKMTMNDRAAQFAPFAALTKFGGETGEYSDEITEIAALTKFGGETDEYSDEVAKIIALTKFGGEIKGSDDEIAEIAARMRDIYRQIETEEEK